VSPFVCCVIALAAGCLCGGVVPIEPEAAVRVALLGLGGLVLAMRLAWGGHAVVGVLGATVAAATLGIALGALAEWRAWTPPGIELDALTRATQAGEPVTIAGVLRRDAWVSEAGDVSLDLAVGAVWSRGRWTETAVGVRATVAGDAAVRRRDTWTRGRRVEASVSSLRRPLPYRNFGVPDAERAMARRRLRLFATVKSASLVKTTPGPWWEEVASRARAHIRAAVATHVRDPVAAATVTAILIGDRSRLPNALVRDLQHAGVYHVVAISGGNVGIWIALLMWLPRATGLAARGATLWLGSGLLVFAVIVDGGASVARAVTVAAVVIAARWWDVRAPAVHALAVAALVQLLADPLALHDPGCVLSFGAAATLVGVASLGSLGSRTNGADGGGRSRWRSALAGLGTIVGATLAIELVLLPITARWFSVATAAGLFANVLAVPAMGVVQLAGLALLAAADWWPGLGESVGGVATLGVHALLRSADVLTIAPWLVREVPPPDTSVLALYYAALTVTFVGLSRLARGDGRCRLCRSRAQRSREMIMPVSCAVVMTACLVWIVTGGVERSAPAPWAWPAAARWQHASWPAEAWLLVTVLDVGQGDATVIRFPSGRTWLVDAGGSVGDSFDVGARVTAPALWALGHRQLDRVVVTHAHPDHAAGMPTVIRRFGPREVLSGIPVADDLRQRAVSGAAHASAARERWLATGESFAEGPVHVSVRHPERPDWERRRVRNDDSIVLWVRHGDVGLLLPGDIGQTVEERLAPRLAAAPLTVLRLPHHGSASSTGHRLLDAAQPALAIGSMARANRFGHPAAPVLGRLAAQPVPLLRTDEVGAIQLATNGRVLLVRTATGLEGSLMAGPPPLAWWLARPLPSDPARRPPTAGPPARAAPRPIRSGG
jgi:competence protein ComEC